jgi:hypothetical protein
VENQQKATHCFSKENTAIHDEMSTGTEFKIKRQVHRLVVFESSFLLIQKLPMLNGAILIGELKK